MIIKGLIKTIDFSDNSCTVRLPLFETAASQGEVISKATILIQPGFYNGYKVGDVVFVDFENNLLNQPIVVGKLYLGMTSEDASIPSGALTVANLKVANSATLPIDTKLVLDKTDTTVPVENGITSYKTISDIIKALYKAESSISQTVKDQSETIAKIVIEYLSQPLEQEAPTADNPGWQLSSPDAKNEFAIWQKTTCYNHRGQILNTEIICLTSIGISISSQTTYYALVIGGEEGFQAGELLPPTDANLQIRSYAEYDPDEDIAEGEYVLNEYETIKDNWELQPPAHPTTTNTNWNYWTTIRTQWSSGESSYSSPIINEDLNGVYALAQGKTTNYYGAEDPRDQGFSIKSGDGWFYSPNRYTPINPQPTEKDAYIGYYVESSAEAGQYILVTSDNINSLDSEKNFSIILGETIAYSRSNDSSTLYQWVGNPSTSPIPGQWQDVGDELIANKVTATYINSHDITAKKITVLTDPSKEEDNKTNPVIFKADGIGATPEVKIGGFIVDADSIKSEKKTNLDSTENGVYIGQDGISIGDGFKVSTSSSGTTMTLSPAVSQQISAVTYWLSSSCVVHTGTKHTGNITVTAMKKVGATGVETVDDNAYLWWRYATEPISDWKKATDDTVAGSSSNLLIIDPTDQSIQIIASHKPYPREEGEEGTFRPLKNGSNINSDNIYEQEEITFSPLNTPVLDLTNDSAAIAYKVNGEKVTLTDTVESTATLYLNGSAISGATYNWELVGCDAIDGQALTAQKLVIKDLSANTATATCTAAYNGESYQKVFTITKQLKGEDGTPGTSPITLEIENDFDSIPCDYEGNISSDYAWATQTKHTLRLFEGTTPVAFQFLDARPTTGNDYSIVYSVDSGITTTSESLSNRTEALTDPREVWITNLSASTDKAKINYTVYKGTDATVLATGCFTAEKRKAGNPGQDAVDYYITVSDTQVKNANGSLTPSNIYVYFYKKEGQKPPEKLTSSDTNFYYTYTATKTSGSSSEGSKTSLPNTYVWVTPSVSFKSMTFKLYMKEGNDYILLDSETVPVIADGPKGADGRAVVSTTKYYKLSTSELDENDKPDIENPSAEADKEQNKWTISPPAYPTSATDPKPNYYETVRTIYDDESYEWSTPIKNSMLTVEFINSLGITTKQIEVPDPDDSSNPVFKASGVSNPPEIKLGGWIIEKDLAIPEHGWVFRSKSPANKPAPLYPKTFKYGAQLDATEYGNIKDNIKKDYYKYTNDIAKTGEYSVEFDKYSELRTYYSYYKLKNPSESGISGTFYPLPGSESNMGWGISSDSNIPCAKISGDIYICDKRIGTENHKTEAAVGTIYIPQITKAPSNFWGFSYNGVPICFETDAFIFNADTEYSGINYEVNCYCVEDIFMSYYVFYYMCNKGFRMRICYSNNFWDIVHVGDGFVNLSNWGSTTISDPLGLLDFDICDLSIFERANGKVNREQKIEDCFYSYPN